MCNVSKRQKFLMELGLIRKFESIIKLKFLDWTDQDYNEFEKWKYNLIKGR